MVSDSTRLTRLIQRLDFARPGKAFDEGWYVAPPGRDHVAARIVERFERSAAPRLLFLGGIGAGKSTALLAAQRRLGGRAHYVAIDTLFDEGGARPGALLVIAGLAIVHALRAVDGTLASRLRPTWKLLHRSLRVRGRPSTGLVDLSLVGDGVSESPETVLGHLETLAEDWRDARAHGAPPVVLLVDSLDRRTWSQFDAAVVPDLRALASYDVGVAIAGSTAWRVAMDDLGDSFHAVWTADVYDPNDADARGFLRAVLAARDEGALAEDVRDAVIECSGGVLRDLLKVADTAARDAAMEGSDVVEVRHVDAAAVAMGEDAIGLLTPSLRGRFGRWCRGEAPEEGDRPLDDGVFESLRARGCVVERGGRWAVHPLLQRAKGLGRGA